MEKIGFKKIKINKRVLILIALIILILALLVLVFVLLFSRRDETKGEVEAVVEDVVTEDEEKVIIDPNAEYIYNEEVDTSKYAEVQLFPFDGTDQDSSFEEFIGLFKEAIASKDLDYVLANTDDNISYSFGLTDGKEGFKEFWGLNEDLNNSEFWEELANVVELGFSIVEYPENKYFIAPYFFDAFPEEFDAYSYLVCTGESVRVRKEPSLDAEVITAVSYLILRDGGSIKGDWQRVILPSGEAGYMHSDYIRAVLDYRVGFRKADGNWKMVYFIAGD